ncbi:MAG: sigma 54-interacting transcriptional regulator [Planctomycetaceae bacterium]|jgi:transcriptional regulator with PAS, ATPase and Fis domain|nr:sigma 54-interacting transcriptional regulator [Planctomycetaceae bacterium]
MKFRPSKLIRFFQSIQQPFFLLDGDASLLFCNNALEEWTGCNAEQLLGQLFRYRVSASRQKHEMIAAALAPPPEVFHGRRCRMLLTIDRITSQSRRYADFIPFRIPQNLKNSQRSNPQDLQRSDAPSSNQQNVNSLHSNGIFVLVDGFEASAISSERQVQERPETAERQAAAELHQALLSFRRRQAGRFRWDRMIGASQIMQRVRRLARLAVDSTASVLIVGEQGTGKEHLASAIHYGQNSEHHGAFVPIECQILEQELINATIYAFRKRFQREEISRRHTLFLKDAEALPSTLYPLIAEFATAGYANQRLIAASTLAPSQWTNHESFPVVLGTIAIELPPLRQRKEDIPMLAQMFLEEHNETANRQRSGFTSDALDFLVQYYFPGNIEELEQLVAEAHRQSVSTLITVSDFPSRIRNVLEAASPVSADNKPIELEPFLQNIEKELIERALHLADDNKSKAAELLGITRPRLYRRLEFFGLLDSESAEN